MEDFYELNSTQYKPWKKALCVLLSVIIALGTFVVLTVGSSRLQDLLGIQSMLSAYAAEIVDTKGAVAIDEESMLADNTLIDLENRDGTNTAYIFSEPITYIDEDGNLKAKDISIEKQSDKKLKAEGYEYTNGQNDYRISFSTDSGKGLYIKSGENSYSIIPQSDNAVIGTENTSEILNEKFEDFEYKNIYGDGTNLKFYPQLNGVKDEIVLDQNIGKNTFSFEIKSENCTAKLNDDGTVSLIDKNGDIVQTFSAPYAFDSEYIDGDYNNHRTDCKYSLESNGEGSYILIVTVPSEWLNNSETVYPVTIDPTTINVDTFRDAGVYSKVADNCYGSEETACIGRSSEYGNGRVYLQFLWPSAIKSHAKINSAFIWMRETTGRTSNMYVQPYLVKSAWKEGTITWNNRARMDDTSDMPTKNINSQSTDWASSPYWYKMYITSAVQKWTNGERNNYGIGLYSTVEETNTYNWRAFATIQHSTSSYKPYTVISYTNDETAPTATVNQSTTAWTNGNVTLSVTGAKDNSGGSGLNATAYSFSTTSGTYSWSSTASKTFSSNCTVYVSVRDVCGNIRTYTQKITNIDKTAPQISSVSGNSDEWTNNDVTLTINGASDSESGLADEAYSFSTAKNVYTWQKESSKTFNDNCTVYAYVRDKAGNIASIDPVTISKIDKDVPVSTNSVEVDNDGWVKELTITANATDEVSGLHQLPYSFSTVENEYNWQEENYKTVTQNGTVYVYVRDNAGNIVLLDTVVVDKIDSIAPVINSLDYENVGDKTILTVSADDNETDIAAYSFDNGETWQESNVFEFEKDLYNYIKVVVKDKAGNTASKQITFYLPQVYYEDDMVGLYNPNPKCEQDIIYIVRPSSNSLAKYERPFPMPVFSNCTLMAYFEGSGAGTGNRTIVKLNDRSDTFFNYKETCEDYKISYKNIDFSVARNYTNNSNWEYSFNSTLTTENNGFFIRVNMPDFSNLVFLKQNKYTYYNESRKYTLSVVYDDGDSNISEYIVKTDKLSYHYNADGILTEITDNYNNSVTITRTDSSVIFKDGKDRTCTVNLNDGKIISIVDFSSNSITYEYDNNHLVAVKDQTGVITSSYEYTDGKITKSKDKSITYDGNHISKITYDNGAYESYDIDSYYVKTNNSTGKSTEFSYNVYGLVTQSVDEYGDITDYNYDNQNRLISVKKSDKIQAEYTYNSNGNLISKKEDNKLTEYSYDNQNRIVRTHTDKSYEYYVYDEFDNVVVSAVLKEDYTGDIPELYDENLDCFDAVKSTYSGGYLIEQENLSDNSRVVYDYDDYGNNIKSTSITQKDDSTSLSVTNYTYDISNRLLTSSTDDSTTSYTYDKAGRTLLINADGTYQRTVYDNKGRVVQEIDDCDYNAQLDNLPNAYGDTGVGYRYEYDEVGNLVKEINRYNIETDYTYSDVGTLYKKHFDIYDYYYNIDGSIDKVDVNGKTIADYEYNITDPSINFEDEETERYFNRVTYADGYVEEHVTDKYGKVSMKIANGRIYYKEEQSTDNSFQYYESESKSTNNIKANNNNIQFSKEKSGKGNFSYNLKTENEIQTVTETHFGGKEYQAVVNKDTITYTAQNSVFTYTFDGNDTSSTEYITNNDVSVLSAKTEYNKDSDILNKSYDVNNISFTAAYGADGNIISDENNQYVYDSKGQLVSSTGLSNSSYTYDDRGNMLTKTVNGETSTFSYDNADWQDQLTSVNDVPLTYDENGNLSNFGNTQYTWIHGKWLNTVTDNENTYSYTYDSNGIRTSKTVNNITTEFDTMNGTVLAQYDGTNNIYFQYKNGVPIGFELNEVQYFYITNLSGDVMGITDSQGSLIAEYTYDEWGKLLNIETAEENNEEQLAIAETNPLRYRGYYYDNETGLYYLQSKYYNPEICRYISAGSFENLDTSNELNTNAYLYCWNNSVAFSETEGTETEVSIDADKLFAFLKNAGSFIKERLQEKFEDLKSRFNAFAEKVKFYFYNPDVLINQTLSFFLGREVNIRFRFIELIKEQLKANSEKTENSNSEEEYGVATYKVMKKSNANSSESNSSNSSAIMAIFQGLFAAIELDWINDILEFFGTCLDEIAKTSYDVLKKICLTFLTTFNTVFDYFKKSFSLDAIIASESKYLQEASKATDYGEPFINAKGIGKGFSGFLSFFTFFLEVDSAGTGIYSKTEDIVMASISLTANIISIFIPNFLISMLVSSLGDIVPQIVLLIKHGYIFPVS